MASSIRQNQFSASLALAIYVEIRLTLREEPVLFKWLSKIWYHLWSRLIRGSSQPITRSWVVLSKLFKVTLKRVLRLWLKHFQVGFILGWTGRTQKLKTRKKSSLDNSTFMATLSIFHPLQLFFQVSLQIKNYFRDSLFSVVRSKFLNRLTSINFN